MAAYVGNSFGEASALWNAAQQHRDVLSQQAFQNMNLQGQQAQAQANWQAQQREAMARDAANTAYQNAHLELSRNAQASQAANQKATQDYNDRVLKWNMEQPSKASVEADKEAEKAKKNALVEKARGLQFSVDNRLPIDWTTASDLSPDILNPLRDQDAAMREKELSDVKSAQEAVAASRRLKMIGQRASEIEKAPQSILGSYPFHGYQDPAAMAKTLRDNAAPLIARYGQYLDPKNGYVVPDPATGDFTVHPALIKPWMAGLTQQTQSSGNSGDFGGETTPLPTAPRAMNIQMPATGTNAPNITAPPQAMTGTNSPGNLISERLSLMGMGSANSQTGNPKASVGGYKVGGVYKGGLQYLGGDPNDPASWNSVR